MAEPDGATGEPSKTGSTGRGPIRHGLSRALHSGLALGFAVLTIDVLWGVFSRYVLGAQSRWTEELALYLLVWVSLVGASVAYADGGHLGVDYLVGKLDDVVRHLARITVELLVMVFAGFVLAYGGFQLVSKTLESGQLSPALGVHMGYVYLAVPLSGALFLIFTAQNLVHLLREAPWNRKS